MAYLVEQCGFCELTEGVLAACQPFSCGSETLDFIKGWFLSTNNKTGCRFVIVDAVNEQYVISFYQKNGFQPLFSSEEQEFAYTIGKKDIPVKLDTRLMYFDLLKMRT